MSTFDLKPERRAKLPVWAREHIARLTRERDDADTRGYYFETRTAPVHPRQHRAPLPALLTSARPTSNHPATEGHPVIETIVEVGRVPLRSTIVRTRHAHVPAHVADWEDEETGERGTYFVPDTEHLTVEFGPANGPVAGYTVEVVSALWNGDSASTIRRLVWSGCAQAAWERARS